MDVAPGKIRPPAPRSGPLLARPALEARLRDALGAHRAVLVSAPAGYGKTALMSRAFAPPPQGTALAWVTLDPGDDLHRLLEALLAALEPYDPPWRVAPEGLMAAALGGDARGRQRAVDEIVHALDATDVRHGTVVLDDLHHLGDDDANHFLARLVERLGPRWTLVLASRDAVAPMLARAAAAGELAVIDEAALQFSADEVQAWLASLGVDADTARLLHARTAGWAAGLRLAITGPRLAAPGATIDRAAFEFLATEVVAHLPPDLRRFLLDTSVLQELDLARCTALTGDAQAARWLDEIERRGLFANVVDEAAGTLRLHDLFRDALRHLLRVERPADEPRLLLRAAQIESDPVRRQALLLAAQRPDDAARALLEVAPDLNTGGAVGTVLRLLGAYPADFTARSAEWQRVAGLATLTVWRLQECERHFGTAEALYRARGDTQAAHTMATRRAGVLVALGRVGEAGPLIERLAAVPDAEFEARQLLATAQIWLGLESGENDRVVAATEELLRLQQGCSEVRDWGTVMPPRQTSCRGMAALTQRWATGALAVAGERPVPLRSFALLALAWRALWLGRPSESQALLDRGMGDASWAGHEVIARSHGLALQAALAVVRGDGPAGVRTMKQRIDEQPAGYGGWGVWQAVYFGARIAGAAGDAAQLDAWVAQLVDLQETLSDLTPQRVRPVLALQGMQALLRGDKAGARARWQALLQHETTADLLGQVGEVRVRLARLAWDGGDRAAAAAWLKPLLDRPEDGPRGAVFAGADVAALANADWAGRLDDAARATLKAWAAGLSPASAGGTSAPAAAPDDDPGAIRTATGERLSERELEVIGLIARGQSNKHIARALDISPYTVKRHVANVLGKLGVESRGQAAAWFHALPASVTAKVRGVA